MNPTTYTLQSVHGIKQTVVLVPSGSPVNSDSPVKQLAAEQPNGQEDRPRSSK